MEDKTTPVQQKKKDHTVLNHTFMAYFLLMIFVSVIISFFSGLDGALAKVVPGFGTEVEVLPGMKMTQAAGPFSALGSIVALGIFWLIFKPEFKGALKIKGMKWAFIVMLPVLLIHWVGSVVSIVTLGTGSVFIAFLNALAPGAGEEITFRGLGVANYMRTIKDEKKIMVIFWLSSIVFGLAHLSNILVGGQLSSVLIQTVYAIGIGMLFGAVYLRTGSILPTIIAHFSLDFLEMIRSDLASSGGTMQAMGVGDWITVAASVVAAVIGLMLVRKKYFPEIMEVWEEKWSGQ